MHDLMTCTPLLFSVPVLPSSENFSSSNSHTPQLPRLQPS